MEKEKLNGIEARLEELQNQIDALRALIDEVKKEPEAESFTEPVDIMLDDSERNEPEPVQEPEPEPDAVTEIQPETEPVSAEPVGAVENTFAESLSYQWAKDIPGGLVSNIISGISLNDRVLLINTLFKEDPILFQQTIAAFNGMASLSEAVEYVKASFPDWNLSSDIVYRLMMAVRRKLK